MKKTTDYSIFKYHNYNRNIIQSNVDKIIKSIKIKNLLEYRPILVNKNMEVVDGQHRLEAAKALGVPVYYEVQEDFNPEDMFHLNANQRSWTADDYLNFYSRSGNNHYIQLEKFKNKHKLKMKDCFPLFGSTCYKGGKAYSDFKQGKFQFPDQKEIERAEKVLSDYRILVEYIASKTNIPINQLSSSCLKKALMWFLNLNTVSFDVFMNKLELKLNLFRVCARAADYLEIFETIYNWRNRDPISALEGFK